MFRIQIVTSTDDFALSDRTRVRPGDRLVNLHLWNEQIPPFPAEGPTLAWARRLSRIFEVSIRELAAYLAFRPDLRDVNAIRANVSFGGAEQNGQLARILEKFGFEQLAAQPSPSFGERMHQLGENILISMMVLARNPAALRADSLWRERMVVVLSRRKLEQHYGLAPDELGVH